MKESEDKNTITDKAFLSQKLFKFPKVRLDVGYINKSGDKDYSLVGEIVVHGFMYYET